jgi:hypothetical protein
MSSAADPTDGPRSLVDTATAAVSLRTSEQQLDDLADAGSITPAMITESGARWWSLHDLRRQVAIRVDPHPDDGRR